MRGQRRKQALKAEQAHAYPSLSFASDFANCEIGLRYLPRKGGEGDGADGIAVSERKPPRKRKIGFY